MQALQRLTGTCDMWRRDGLTFRFLDDIAAADLPFEAGGDSLRARRCGEPQAKRVIRRRQIQQHGILVKAVSMSGPAEDAGFAYKNISDVVASVDRAGIRKAVTELRPMGNIKG
jgi:hypothetical protein